MDFSRFLRGPEDLDPESSQNIVNTAQNNREASNVGATSSKRKTATFSSQLRASTPEHISGGMDSRPGTSKTVNEASRLDSRKGGRPSDGSSSTGDGHAIPGGNQFLNKPHGGKDSVNRDILQTVRQTFIEADNDGSGQLAPEEFVKAFTGMLQTDDGGDEEALSKLFCRIDANCDGTIDWNEFSSYMLLESAGAASIRELETGIDLKPPVSHRVPESLQHQDVITHMSHIQMTNGKDRYVTCGKDGLVKVWNPKGMELLKTINTGKSWVTCSKLLPVTQKLAVASFSRSMKVYDLNTYEMCGVIQDIDYAPMAMDSWVPRRNREAEMVVFGDGGGYVRLYEVRINPLVEKNSNDRYLDKAIWKHQHHSDWVTCIKYVEDLNCVIAGSLDKLVSITDAEERVPLKVLEGHTKGVTSVDWSPLYKFVCSGSLDRKVILWNPFSQKPLAQLTGHAGSVQQIIVNDKDNQIISLGSDKTVKVWDIRNHKCLQTLQDKEIYKLDNTIFSMAFDHQRKLLLTGNQQIKTWQQIITTSSSSGHREPVTKVIYNSLFNEAISGDIGGTVSVWHVPTGKLRFRFYNAHKGQEITAMNFDTNKRRLITGAGNGEVKVWNFSSGSCISVLKPSSSSRQEVTSVMAVRGALVRSFLVAGWDRKITFFEDRGHREADPGRCLRGHEADILDMALMENSPELAAACDDGTVWIWNIDSGSMRKKLSPDGLDKMAVNERAAEAVRFLHGGNHHVLAVVYADRYMRLWDAHSGKCLLEVFTGHKLGESVISLAVDPTGQRIATADSAGFVKIWDSSSFLATKRGTYSGEISEVCVFKGHREPITALDWSEQPDGGVFLISSSLDKDIKLWTPQGALVGVFGIGMWKLDDPLTWKAQEIKPLEERDSHEIETSRLRPEKGSPGSPTLQRHLSKHYTFSAEGQGVSAGRPSTAPEAVAGVLRASYVQRQTQVTTFRISQRVASMQRKPSGLMTQPSDALSELNLGGVSPGSPKRTPAAAPPWLQDLEEGNEDDDAVESEASSNHSSDEDVPTKLWMEEFEATRKTRMAGAIRGSMPPRSTPGKRTLYLPPKGVSELSELPSRPSTSYSSRGGR